MQLLLLTEYNLRKYLIVLTCILIFRGYLPTSPYNAELHVVNFTFKSHLKKKYVLFLNYQC